MAEEAFVDEPAIEGGENDEVCNYTQHLFIMK